LDLDQGLGDKCLGDKECLVDKEGFLGGRNDSDREDQIPDGRENSDRFLGLVAKEGLLGDEKIPNDREDSSWDENLKTRGGENVKNSTPNSQEGSTLKYRKDCRTGRVKDCPSGQVNFHNDSLNIPNKDKEANGVADLQKAAGKSGKTFGRDERDNDAVDLQRAAEK
jgi:hypothetical protein